MLRANPKSPANVRDGGSIVPGRSRPERTASRKAVSSRSLAPRAPGVMASRKSRCRSRLPELAHEVTPGFNHERGFFRISVVHMTLTMDRTDRIKIYKESPELLDAMMSLSTASAKDIDPQIGELIKIRASQINGCAFCLDMHVKDARKHGVDEQKLDILAAWKEVPSLFTDRERAALALTEAITNVGQSDVSDDVFGRAAEVFSERELAQVIAMAVTINAWNRINVTIRLQPPNR